MFLYFIIIKICLHFLFCCLYLVVFSFWFLCYVFGFQFKFVFSSFFFIIFVLVNTPYFILFGYGCKSLTSILQDVMMVINLDDQNVWFQECE
jgi:hypothetical protein